MSELKTAAQLLVHHQILALLLAREAVFTGKPLNDLHQGFVSGISEVLQRLDFGSPGEQIEAAAHAELDRIFVLAAGISRAMPARGGPADS